MFFIISINYLFKIFQWYISILPPRYLLITDQYDSKYRSTQMVDYKEP